MNNWTQWGIGIGLTIAMAVAGYTIHRVDAIQIETNKTFLTKDEYSKDQKELCNALDRIMERIDRNNTRSDERMDKVLDLLQQHENAAIKRDKAYK